MQINTEYYGTGRDTSPLGFEYTDYTIVDALNNGDLPFNEQFDQSICPWVIGEGSDIFNQRFPIIYSDTDTPSALSSYTIGDYPIWDNTHGYKWYFYYQPNSQDAKRSLWYDGRSMPSTTETIPPIPSYVQQRNNNRIVTNFDYSKLVIAPMMYTSEGHLSIDDALAYFDPATYNPNGSYQIYGIRPLYWYYDETHEQWKVLGNFGIAGLNMGIPYGGNNPDSQYDEEWFDSCINLISGMPALGGDGSTQRHGGYAIVDGTEFKASNKFKMYDTLYPTSVNYPQYDNDNRVGDHKIIWLQGGEHWEQRVSEYHAPVPRVENYTYIDFVKRFKLEDFETQQEVKEYILTQLAYLGCYFIESDEPATSDYPLKNNANVYLPEITGGERAITTGNYAKGTAQSQWDNSNWSDDPWQHTPDPSDEDYDPNKYSDKTDWNNPTVTGFTAFSKEYKLTHLGVMDLCGQFYASLGQIVDGQTAEDYYNRTFLTNNPTDVIVSLRYYDIDLETALPTTGDTTVPVTLGAYTTNVNGWRTDAVVKRFTLGSCTYHPHFGDFRDFEPYSYAELVIPYCGSLQISPSEFMGHKLQVDLVIDFGTGQCTAYVYRDNLVIDSLPGQIGVDVPVSAVASADLQRDLYNNAAQLRSAKISGQQALIGGVFSTVANIATGNIAGAVSSGLQTILGQEQSKNNIDVAQYNLEHTQVHYKQVGAATPGQSVLQERNARLIIYRPVMGTYDPATYGHTTGFACLDHSKLSNYNGFVQCANIVTDGIAATEQEKQLIIQALQSGVYV